MESSRKGFRTWGGAGSKAGEGRTHTGITGGCGTTLGGLGPRPQPGHWRRELPANSEPTGRAELGPAGDMGHVAPWWAERPYLAGEDLHKDLVPAELVPQDELVLSADGHVLAHSDHAVVTEHLLDLPPQEPDKA